MGKRSTNYKIRKLVSTLISLAVIFIFVGLAFTLINSYPNYNSFTVLYMGKSLEAESTLNFPVKTNLRFNCSYDYTFAQSFKSCGGVVVNSFDVKIIPNENAEDFYFSVDGDLKSYLSETDLSAGFDLTKDNGGFEFIITRDIPGILTAVYPLQIVNVPSTNYDNALFMLVITAFDGKTEYKVDFEFDTTKLIQLKLNKNGIIF